MNSLVNLSAQLVKKCLEQIFPERSDHKIVRELDEEVWMRHVCPCDHGEFISLVPFDDPEVRAVIHEAKFHHNEKAWRLLSLVLHSYLRHCVNNTILLPIPLSLAREKKRGYNQVLKIITSIPLNKPDMTIRNDILYRTRDTKPQSGLKRSDRLKNVAGAFGARHVFPLHDHHCIIIDDVVTTASTLKAAKAALLPLRPASITLLSLAH